MFSLGIHFSRKGINVINPREMKVSRDVVFDEMSKWYADVKDFIGVNAHEHVVAKNASQ